LHQPEWRPDRYQKLICSRQLPRPLAKGDWSKFQAAKSGPD
jgi:hypothetical protein